MSEEIHCNRCGKCCHVLVDDKLIKCKFLIKLANNKFLCRNYNQRIGTIIVPGKFRCGPRVTSRYDYPSCPFNTNKELAPQFKEKIEKEYLGLGE